MARARGAGVAVLIGVVLHLLMVGAALVAGEGTPEWFVHFAEDGLFRSVADQEGIEVRAAQPHVFPPQGHNGHDGQRFWIQARDPLLTDPDQAEARLIRPVYRYQRVLYPLVASPWRLAGEDALFVGMVVTNLVVVGFGTWWTARLAVERGLTPLLGLAFALNPVVILSTLLDLSDAMALAGLFAALLAVRVGRPVLAATAGSLGVLAKEPVGAALAAVAVLGGGLATRLRLALVLPPAAVGLAWGVYVRLRLGWVTSESVEFRGVPFSGWLDTWHDWWLVGNTGDAMAAVLALALCVAALVLWIRHGTLELCAALPFVLLLPFVSNHVLFRAENSLRAVGPVFTILALEWFALRAVAGSSDGPRARPETGVSTSDTVPVPNG